MEDKRQQHAEKTKALQKHFKKLKLISVLCCIAFNIVVDAVVMFFASPEIILFTVIVVLMVSCMFLFNYLKRLYKIKITQ